MARGSSASGGGPAASRPRRPSAAFANLRRLARTTFSICLRHRVTGLAAEIGFFAILSLPPLVLGLVGTLGYFADVIGPDTVESVRANIIDVSRNALSDQAVKDVIIPTLNDVLDGGRFDIVSLGFLLALWSGSRALNTMIDTIAIMYGLGGHRGIIATRALSFSLYIVGLVIAVVLAPPILAGPDLVSAAIPDQAHWVMFLYWPLVIVMTMASLTTLYWIAVPVPNAWRRCLPGAGLTLVGWLLGSFLVRKVIDLSVGGTSIYGPLAASIVVLIWLYVLAISMLIGAAFNAAVDRQWPQRKDDHTLDGIPVLRAARPSEPSQAAVPPRSAVPPKPASGNSGDEVRVLPVLFNDQPNDQAAPELDEPEAPAPEEVKRHGRL
ncbi:MAG TPA: YihY/virulence factor BrkB family protein [Sporichthya sp.]|nr:YihY/virulence factor BrkB family protein [Sporichthya sp.]